MPANINSMFYTREQPWHGLGTRLEKAATAQEALTAAGLDWEVAKKHIFLEDRASPIPNKYAIVRQDNQSPLGIVGQRYIPLQNRDAFRFFDAVVGLKEAIYETAGALGRGEIIWVLAKLNGVIRVVGNDITQKYLLLTNWHNGGGAVRILWTPIRVVCQNTLNIALGSGHEDLHARLRHTNGIGLKVEEVRNTLGIIDARFKLFEEASQRLATVQLTQDAWRNYVAKLGLASQNVDNDKSENNFQKIYDTLTPIFEKGRGNDMPGVRGTAWAAFNAVTEYTDYARIYRNDDNRAKSLLFGSGAKLKQAAWDLALDLAK